MSVRLNKYIWTSTLFICIIYIYMYYIFYVFVHFMSLFVYCLFSLLYVLYSPRLIPVVGVISFLVINLFLILIPIISCIFSCLFHTNPYVLI